MTYANMNQNQRILFFCIEKRSQKEISKQLKWTKGATSTAIKRLVEKELLKKIKRGIYETTKKGIESVSEYFENEEEKDFGIFIEQICMSLMLNGPALNEEGILTQDTSIIYDEIIKIFFESVVNNHGSNRFTWSMWQIHEEYRCNEHGFNFENAFSKNAKILTEYTHKSEVFNTIHENSLPMREQFKKNPRVIYYRLIK